MNLRNKTIIALGVLTVIYVAYPKDTPLGHIERNDALQEAVVQTNAPLVPKLTNQTAILSNSLGKKSDGKVQPGEYIQLLRRSFAEAKLNNSFIDRDLIREEGKKNPLQFAKEMNVFLKEIPLEQVDVRKIALSFLADVIADSHDFINSDHEYATSTFDEIYEISDDILSQRELVDANMNYEEYETLSPREKTDFVEKNGQIFKSTLQPKIISVGLIKLDSNSERSEKYLDRLSSKIGDLDENSQKAINSMKDMDFMKVASQYSGH